MWASIKGLTACGWVTGAMCPAPLISAKTWLGRHARRMSATAVAAGVVSPPLTNSVGALKPAKSAHAGPPRSMQNGDLVGQQIVTARGPLTAPAVADEIGCQHAIAIAEKLDERAPLTAEAR